METFRDDEKGAEAENWEKRIISAEIDILTVLEIDIFWAGVEWILSAAVELANMSECLAKKLWNLHLVENVWQLGQFYA